MDRKCNIIADNGCEMKISEIIPKINEDNLIKISNKGIYKRGLKDLESVSEAEISCSGEFVNISFGDIKVAVKDDFSGISCSCQSKTVCRHIITGLLILSECGVEASAETEKEPEPEKEIKSGEKDKSENKTIVPDTDYINEVISFVEAVMKKGIINCNEGDVDTAVQLSLKAENTVHNNISLMLRGFSADIEKLNAKSAEFVSVNTFHLISRIYNTSLSIIKNSDSYEKLKILCSESKSYDDMANMSFIGLGAYPWSTKSGYAGITALLYCEDDHQIYTYSSSAAYIHEKTSDFNSIQYLSQSFKSHSHWQNSASMFQISGSSFRLFGGKANSQNRLSSSKNTFMNVSGFTTYSQITLIKDRLSAEKYLVEDDDYDYFAPVRTEKICIISAEEFRYINYDKVRQILEFSLYDGKNEYPCEILWNEQNRNAVSYIESLARKSMKLGRAFVCRYINGVFVPVSLTYDNKINSFYFD